MGAVSTLHVSESMSVEFDVTRADVEKGVARQLESTAAARRSSTVQSVLMCFFVFVVVAFMIYGSVGPGWPRTVALIGYSAFAFWLLLNVIKVGRNPVKKIVNQVIAASGERAVLGLERISISSSGVRSDHANLTLMQAWPGVQSVDCREDGISIQTGPSLVWFVPRRAFASEDDMRDFVKHATAWRTAAQSWSDACPGCGKQWVGAHRDRCVQCGWQRERIDDSTA